MKIKLHIIATHKKTFKKVDLFFYSIAQAKKFNPGFMDFNIIGLEQEVKK